MASSMYDWSQTAINNQNSDSGINWLEGQDPGTVNGSARAMMGRAAEILADLGGALTAGGTANALTVTANSAFTTNANGHFLAFRAASDNTAAATLNVNGIGAKSIRKVTSAGDVALSGAEIQADGIYVVHYSEALNGAAGGWQLQNPTLGDQSSYVAGPATSTDNAIVRFDSTTGKLIQNSGVTIDDTNTVTITSTAAGALLTLESQDAGAGFGPGVNLYRNSASPAASDIMGAIFWSGRDSAGNVQAYGDIYGSITDATSGSEDFSLNWETTIAGANGLRMILGNGLYMATASGGDKGLGTFNAVDYYLNGVNSAEVTLTDAATIVVDMATFLNAVVTLGGNRAMGNPTNEKAGTSGCIRIVQDGTGTRTLSYGTDWEFAGGTAPTLSTAAGAQDLLFYYVIATDRIFANLIKATA